MILEVAGSYLASGRSSWKRGGRWRGVRRDWRVGDPPVVGVGPYTVSQLAVVFMPRLLLAVYGPLL